MIACLLDLRSVGLGRVTFPRLVHYSPRSGQTRVAIGAAFAACTIAADRDHGSICIHCDDDDPRVAVFVFGGMQHATDGRGLTANGGDGFQRGREKGFEQTS